MLSPVIQISSLSRRFGEMNAVNQLTFDVQEGEIFGFLGHNGAGKTTTIRLLNGVLEPTSGEACVLGLNPQTEGPALRCCAAAKPLASTARAKPTTITFPNSIVSPII